MAVYEDLRRNRLTTMETIKAVNAQKKVGAEYLKVNPNRQKQSIGNFKGKGEFTIPNLASLFQDFPPPTEDKTKPGEIVKNNKTGKLELKITSESRDPSVSWKGKKWSEMSGAEKFQGGAAVAGSVLNTLDMLTGGQDKILPGSGHTYSSGYNPEMYIGQGPGY